MKQRLLARVPVEDLTPETFAPYGSVIELPKVSPNKVGPGWDCWSPVGFVRAVTTVGVGIVHSQARPLVVTEMERHVSREEILWPTNTEIVQPMALPEKLDDPAAQPDPRTVRAFRIKPGQAIVMVRGAWHSPAYPLQGNALYFFAIENKSDDIGDNKNPWVPFPEDGYVEMVRF